MSTVMVKKINWVTLLFFVATTSVALIAGPWYVIRYGVSGGEMALMLFLIAATGLAITVGYHRLYAHSTYKTNKFIEFIILFFGAAAFEQSALIWSSGHRDHHRYVDTEKDPYSIKKGFWYAHIGWMTMWQQIPDFDNAKDLLKNKMLMFQHNYYAAVAVFTGILFPVWVGSLFGHALGAFILAVCVRLTFVYHATFCINSICHTIGKQTYDIHATARDHWFVALVTNGEGYHNFHHRFPTDFRNGIRWYDWDPSKWIIAMMGRLGLCWDLQTVSQFNILQARISAENQDVVERLAKINDHHHVAHMKEKLQVQYAILTQKLSEWEANVKTQRAALSATMAHHSDEWKSSTHARIEHAKADFFKARQQWKALIMPRKLTLQTVSSKSF